MNQSAFAGLCGVSPKMISKYKDRGLVVVVDGEVDVAGSLAALEGRLDEAKRSKALLAFAEMTGQPLAHDVRDAAPVPVRSAKAEKDEVELKLKRLEYAREAGELVEKDEVEDSCAQAVAAFRESLANGRRETADMICAEFGIASTKAAQLAKFLQRRDERALGRFADVMGVLAAEAANEARGSGTAPTQAAA